MENLIILFLVQVMTGESISESSGEFQMYPCGRENLWYNSGMNLIDLENQQFIHNPLSIEYDHSRNPHHPALDPEFVATFHELTDTQRSSQANIAICNIELMSAWRYTEKHFKQGETYFHRGERDQLQPFFTFKSPCGYKKLTCEFNNLLAFECELKHGVIEKILKILDPIPW